MIRLDFTDWPSVESIGPIESGGGPSLITGEPAPLPLGSFVVHADPFAAGAPDDDPVTTAEGMRGNAQRALDLMQATVSANRDLDSLMTSVIDAPDWRDGVTKFDKGLAELKQKNLPRFKDAEDSTAFARELEEFAAIRRIDLKSALARKQQDEALTGLDDALTYYATQAATARYDQFREIAIERGLTAIDRMAAAGYLFPETAKKLEAQFYARVDAADLESIVSANPEEALGILDNPALFPRADAATRERLKDLIRPRPMPVGANPTPIQTREWREDRDGPPPELVPLSAAAAEPASTPEPHHGVGVGDYEIPINGESGNGAAATEANEQPPTEGSSAAETRTPGTWQALLGEMLNMDLGRQQGLTPHDLVNAKPLPDDLAKYDLKPSEATEANITELLPLLRADANKLGLDVIVRWDPGSGAAGFAVRPEGSSAHVVEGDGALAKGLNRAAEVAYALGSILGLNFGGPAPGALATGARAAGAIKTGHSADEAVVSTGGVGGPPKAGSSAWRSVLAKAADGFTSVKERLREQFSRVEKGSPAAADPVDIGPISEEGAKRLNAQLRENGVDLDLTGYRHNVDAYASRHTYKEHGTPETELPRGQLPVTADDWAKIPEILSDFDRASPVGKTDIGREAIGYWKQINGHVLYVEEVRTGRKTLSAVAMRKFKGNLEDVAPGRPDDL